MAVITPSDLQFREAFETARVSNSRLARYYLRSLEMAAKEEPEPWFVPVDDKSVINLEHVLPRKPEANWPSLDEEAVRSHTNRLGNLALMKANDNSEAKSSAFADKRSIYGESPYVLTNQIAELDDWTTDSIRERQRALAALAVKTWQV